MEKTIALTSGVLGPDEVQELQKLVTNGITVTLLLPKTSSFNNINLRILSELGLKVNIGLEQTYQDLLVCMGDNTIGGFYNSETVSSLSKINPDHIKSYIFESSIMYMIYWHNRLVSKVDKQRELRSSLINYIGKHGNQEQTERIVDMWLHDEQLIKESESYVERRLLSKKTVDLVILQGKGDQKKVLCMQRDWFPEGMALPGGFILDSDEDNELGLDPFMFAALRIGSTKVLHSSNLIYGNDSDENGHKFYFVADKRGNRLKLYSHKSGYHYTDRLQNMIEPSDPRHLVDTIGYELEYEGESLNDLERKDKKDIMDSKIQKGGLVFGHQREIIAHLSSRTSIDDLKGINHPEWIRNIIKNPLDSYKSLQERFKANNNSPETSMPELFPIVFTMKKNLFSEKYNNLCKSNPILNGVRLSVYNTLEHVSFQNRILCPYSSTIRAILSCIDFFDMCVRLERGFYNELDNDKFTHQDPTKINNAFYHTYRYEYRYNELMSMIPNEILIPTYESLSATDLMKVRGVPIRFIGLADEFTYVDEFLQSPKEFFMHDINHSYRMAQEDLQFRESMGLTKEAMIEQSNTFLKEYLEKIKVLKTDTEQEREIKKLKKIILFEIVHEDARPFFKDIICEYIQQIEGNSVPFEVPVLLDGGQYRDVTDLIDTGIATLSYVRNKLQNGFYDEVDNQIPQIVSPEYRKAEWIGKAAYEMLVELGAKPLPQSEIDEKGNVSYDRIMHRVCSVGPHNIHNVDFEDPAMKIYGDGAKYVNPKRYTVE